MLESQEIEEKLLKSFKKLEQKFNKLDRLDGADEKRNLLGDVTSEIDACKR